MAAEKARKGIGKRLYPTIADAIDARIKVVSTYPGTQTLSYEAARAIVSRSIALASSPPNNMDLVDMSNLQAGPVYMRYDPKLLLPNMLYMTEEQILSIMGEIKAPTFAIMAGVYLCDAPFKFCHLEFQMLQKMDGHQMISHNWKLEKLGLAR